MFFNFNIFPYGKNLLKALPAWERLFTNSLDASGTVKIILRINT
jgi:hypothetical protein